MALAINIEDLLNKQKIESNRIEFKKGWNPASIYHSVCAFANDIDDLGGGYIVVGAETDNSTGIVKRPVNGIPTEKSCRIVVDVFCIMRRRRRRRQPRHPQATANDPTD